MVIGSQVHRFMRSWGHEVMRLWGHEVIDEMTLSLRLRLSLWSLSVAQSLSLITIVETLWVFLSTFRASRARVGRGTGNKRRDGGRHASQAPPLHSDGLPDHIIGVWKPAGHQDREVFCWARVTSPHCIGAALCGANRVALQSFAVAYFLWDDIVSTHSTERYYHDYE